MRGVCSRLSECGILGWGRQYDRIGCRGSRESWCGGRLSANGQGGSNCPCPGWSAERIHRLGEGESWQFQGWGDHKHRCLEDNDQGCHRFSRDHLGDQCQLDGGNFLSSQVNAVICQKWRAEIRQRLGCSQRKKQNDSHAAQG
jgi:hypothetical protein